MTPTQPAGVGASSAATALLELGHVGKRFAGTVALDGVDLTVAAGEFVAVVGPSGCGKSTLLRLAAGLTHPTSGTVNRQAATIGYVFQDPTLLDWRTVSDNVQLPAELTRVPKRERRPLADEALRLVGLTDFAAHLPHMLSGGMRMRASLARALILQPELFLLDEPFGALDEITRHRLGDELVRLFELRRFAAVFVTHSVAEAVYLSNRVVVMSPRPGRILDSFTVPFAYPRTAELRHAAAFAALTGQVSACLRRADQEPAATSIPSQER